MIPLLLIAAWFGAGVSPTDLEAGAGREVRAGAGSEARTDREIHFGVIPFGASEGFVETVYPDARPDRSRANVLRVAAETPGYVLDPEIAFTFGDAGLEEVFVYGPIMDAVLTRMMLERYGRPASVRDTIVPESGDATEATWFDESGNCLSLTIYHGPHDVSLRYRACARAKHEVSG